MKMNKNTGLVLEGGGMRGVFTSGVLDAFMKYDLYFPYVVAVSAGACNGMSYMSRQPRRARISNIDYLARYQYIGIHHLVTQGCIFDRELLYDKFPNQLLPFDFDTYFKYADRFEMVTTNCLTGQPMYLSETNHERQRALDIVRASSSLPFVSKIVNVDGIPMLDGEIVDSIPVQHAFDKGFEHNVVVLTRNKGWRDTSKDRKLPYLYKNYPRLRVALSHRHKVYNEQIQLVDDLEAAGKITCIRPIRPLEVGRIEKDTAKLERLYEEGFMLGEKFCEKFL